MPPHPAAILQAGPLTGQKSDGAASTAHGGKIID